MENNNSSAEPKSATAEEQNPSNNSIDSTGIDNCSGEPVAAQAGDDVDGRRSRRPFTDLSQVDADLALARTLQEQERAYMMLSMNTDRIHFGSWDAANYSHEDDFLDDVSEEEYDGSDADQDDEVDDEEEEEDEEDAFDVHAHAEANDEDHQGLELDPSSYSSDEAYARALQDAEEREMAARLLALAGFSEGVFVGNADDDVDDDDVDDDDEDDDDDDNGENSQDAWEEVDPDEMSYEELIALGEVVGTESRGLPANTIASLPSIKYKSQSSENGISDSCVICRCDYEDDETLTLLSCKHTYHSECINNWLCQNKVCPICNAEVSSSTSGTS